MARILVIDDEEQVRSLLVKVLSQHGHTAVPAANGQEGSRLFREEPCDVVISDIFMPEKEGLETILELKKEFPGVRIIAISGGGKSGDLGFLQTAAMLGAEITLTKPVDTRQLLESVAQLIK